jgi:hypothetical protein
MSKNSNIKNNDWTFYTSVPSSLDATASLFESFGIFSYFLPFNLIVDAIHQYQYNK